MVFASVAAARCVLDEVQRKEWARQGADLTCIQVHHVAGNDEFGVWQERFRDIGWAFTGSLAERTSGKQSKKGRRAGVGGHLPQAPQGAPL